MANAHAGLLEHDTALLCELTDRQLLTRYVGLRDEAAFVSLLDRHAQTVWRVCRRVLGHEQDAEDAFQAVFLVLARNAGSIRNSDAVASWLHGVAYRVSMKAQRIARRRPASEEGAVIPSREPPPSSQAACLELQRQLDEELQRLSEIYRAPFVLCCLEGKSKAEAARELGCKEGTVSGRLARARKLLQKRLARRGITLAGVLTAAALAPETGLAAVPASLAQTTASAALNPQSGGLAPSVRALVDDFLRPPTLTRRLLAVLLVAGLFLLLGSGSLVVSLLPLRDAPAQTPIEPDTFLAPGVPLGTPLDEHVAALAFSSDGRRLVTAGGKSQIPGQIKIWDVASARELTAVRPIPGVRALAFSPVANTFATGDVAGALTLRDADTANELNSVQAHPGGVQGVAFSSDGALLATGGADGMVRLWRGDNLKLIREWRAHRDKISAVTFFHRDQLVATASEDRSAKVWDARTGEVKCTLGGHQGAVEAVAVSPDDRLVATASRDETVRVWDATNGTARQVLPVVGRIKGKGRQAYAIAFSPDGTLLAGAGQDGLVRLWDTTTWQPAGMLDKHTAPVWALAFSQGGVLASGSADRTAKLWHLKGTRPPVDLMTSWSGARPILAAAYAPDGAVVAVATVDKSVHLRDAKTGDVIGVLHGHTDHVTCLAFSADGKTLASGSKDRTFKLWDPASGDIRHTLTGHAGAVQALTFIPGAARLASAGADGTIRLWDTALGKETAMLQAHDGPVAALACAADGRLLASGADRTIKLWNLTNGEVRPAQPADLPDTGPIRALAISETGVLASAGEDGAIRLWDLSRAAPAATLKGHAGPVLVLAFTPRGRTLVSGGQDHTIRVWEGASGASGGVLVGHHDVVTTLAIHPQGHDLVSGSFDTRLLRWQAGVVRGAPLPAVHAVVLQEGPTKQPAEPAEDKKEAVEKLDKVDAVKKEPKNDAGKADAPQPQGDISYDFRGAQKLSPPFRMLGIDQGASVKPEADGLRITIPAHQARRHRAGIEWRTPIKGNFEITVGYDILAADQPEDGYGVGFEMYLNAATIAQDRLGFYRLNRPLEGDSYMVGRAKTENGRSEHKNTCTPALGRSGVLRLTRREAEVTAWAAEGAKEPFQQIQQSALGAADVTRVWFAAYVGNTDLGVDVRIVDLKIRSNLPDDDPVLAPAIVPALAAAEDVPGPAQDRSFTLLIVVGVFGLAMAACLLVGVGITIVRGRRSSS